VNTRTFRRAAAILGGSALAGSLLFVPAIGQGTPAAAEDSACVVTGGSLTWGVKESFRSYISGRIANGSWEPSEGATYETPDFQWSGATGEIDPETGTGVVSFVGTVHFTGHDGVLDLTMANPTVEFEGDGKAALLLDTRSTDATGELAIDAEQEWVGEIAVPEAVAPQNSELELTDMETILTNSGAKAFAGFYEPGVDLDPISVSLQFEDCDVAAAPVGDDTTPGEDPAVADAGADAATDASPASSEVPWLPIGIGAVALLVIGITVGMLLGGRKPKPKQSTAPDDGTVA
jgi:hypothetical protein